MEEAGLSGSAGVCDVGSRAGRFACLPFRRQLAIRPCVRGRVRLIPEHRLLRFGLIGDASRYRRSRQGRAGFGRLGHDEFQPRGHGCQPTADQPGVNAASSPATNPRPSAIKSLESSGCPPASQESFIASPEFTRILRRGLCLGAGRRSLLPHSRP